MSCKVALAELHREEDGNNTVLGIGYVVLLLLLIAVVVFVTEVNIAARQLWATTDSAAQAAADVAPPEASEVALDYASETDFGVDPTRLQHRVEEYLRLSGAYDQHRGLRIDAVTVDGTNQTVRVQLSAEAAGPILHSLLPAGVPVRSESAARLVLSR